MLFPRIFIKRLAVRASTVGILEFLSDCSKVTLETEVDNSTLFQVLVFKEKKYSLKL